MLSRQLKQVYGGERHVRSGFFLPAAESNQVHLIRFHLSAFTHEAQGSLRFLPCTSFASPTTGPTKRLLQTRFSLCFQLAPPVLLRSSPAEESKRVHCRHFHLSASLTGHKVRSQAPSPPCTPLPAPTTPPPSGVRKLASLCGLLVSDFGWASLQAEI